MGRLTDYSVLRGASVLITGGLGFIGSNLARRLVELGAQVTLVDSLIPEYDGNLNVLDSGGSLGSTCFQNRRFLERLSAVRWNIVEQSRQVQVGKADFEDERLIVSDC